MLNKIWTLLTISLLLTGCGEIKLQMNTMELMQNYQFNEPADEVYAGAVKFFAQEKLPLETASKNNGISKWKTTYKTQGSLSHYRKVRYNVKVTAKGNKSILQIHEESVAGDASSTHIGGTLGGAEMNKPDSIRKVAYELLVLESFNPSAAQKLKAQAASM